MRNPLALGAATLLVALSLGVTACGSDSDSEDTLSKTDLIAKADEICSTYNAKIQDLVTSSFKDGQPNVKDLTAMVSNDLVPYYEDELSELQSLSPDSESADAWNGVVDKLDSGITSIKENPGDFVSGSQPLAKASAAAQDFGLKVCGSGAAD